MLEKLLLILVGFFLLLMILKLFGPLLLLGLLQISSILTLFIIKTEEFFESFVELKNMARIINSKSVAWLWLSYYFSLVEECMERLGRRYEGGGKIWLEIIQIHTIISTRSNLNPYSNNGDKCRRVLFGKLFKYIWIIFWVYL